MTNKQITQYVADARLHGMNDEMIREELMKSGWGQADINDAFQLRAPMAPTVPALQSPAAPGAAQVSMWVAFQYAICFICLYITAIALNSICGAIIDQWIPNPAMFSNYYSGTGGLQIQFQLASLIVAAPIFVGFFMVVRRQIRKNPSVRALPLRKGVIYITLFIASIIVIADLIWNIYEFLSADFSANGLLHLLVLVLIAGSVIAYLSYDIKEDRALLA